MILSFDKTFELNATRRLPPRPYAHKQYTHYTTHHLINQQGTAHAHAAAAAAATAAGGGGDSAVAAMSVAVERPRRGGGEGGGDGGGNGGGGDVGGEGGG